jgi:hypothetical protein
MLLLRLCSGLKVLETFLDESWISTEGGIYYVSLILLELVRFDVVVSAGGAVVLDAGKSHGCGDSHSVLTDEQERYGVLYYRVADAV